MVEVGGAVEVDGEVVASEAAVHVGAECDAVAATGELFDVVDVAEDVGEGGAAVFGRVDEEGGEEVDADADQQQVERAQGGLLQ